MPQLDWSKLPASLRYLQEPAEKYGAIEFDGLILEFLDKASQEQLNELRSLANRIRLNGDVDTTNRWIDAYPISEHEESARVYFFMLLLDLAGFDFGSSCVSVTCP
jgi:hypothetical protein